MQNPNAMVLFLHLLMRAAYKEKKIGIEGQVIILERGQLVTGRKSLAKELKLSERKIRTAMALLLGLEIVTSKATSKYSVITIENYGQYQDVNPGATSSTANKRPASDQQATTIEESKNIELKEYKEPRPQSAFGVVMRVFKEENVQVTDRPAKLIALIENFGKKVGNYKLERIARMFLRDPWHKQARTLNKLLDHKDKFLDRLNQEIAEKEAMNKRLERASSNQTSEEYEADSKAADEVPDEDFTNLANQFPPSAQG